MLTDEFTALRASGRLIVITMTLPTRSTSAPAWVA
jgi:hypothetical protein